MPLPVALRRFLPCLLISAAAWAAAEDPWLVYQGSDGPGAGKQVVLVSGDEEYRSEEVLPLLARMLADHHGFHCTVLFPWNNRRGYIDPNHQRNIPGLEALDQADLLIIFTRFRNLPDNQMAAIDRYVAAGKPVLGIRTATHAFQFPGDSPWAHYANAYSGGKEGWEGGFGRVVLGEQWVSHHGDHKGDSTHGIIAPGAHDHPITRGIDDKDIWGSTDVYGVRLPLPGDSRPLVLGQVTLRTGEYDPRDIHYGMRSTDREPRADGKNDPMMPIAWTRTYQLPGGEPGRAFTSTIGASADLLSEGTRRLLIHGALWCVGLEDAIPEEGANADITGAFNPTQYDFRDAAYWRDRALQPNDLR